MEGRRTQSVGVSHFISLGYDNCILGDGRIRDRRKGKCENAQESI